MNVSAEGQSSSRPPFFNGEDYTYWKTRMRIFLQGQDFDILNIIESKYIEPTVIVEGE